MSTRFLEALKTGRVLLMDGAMGTELIRRGLEPEKEKSHEWNTTHPDEVREIHKAYFDAGAVCLLTNTFLLHEAPSEGVANYKAGINLARSVGNGAPFVMADIGGPWPFCPPRIAGLLSSTLLAESDALLLETLNSLQALVKLVEDSPTFPGFPCVPSFSFRRRAGGIGCLRDGCGPEAVAGFVDSWRERFVTLGVNCGRDMSMDDIIEVVRRYRKVTDLPILARPNAGTPIRMAHRWIYPHSPKSMAARLPELIDAGATLIGGCCGTTPAHIAAFREVIDRLGVGWNP